MKKALNFLLLPLVFCSLTSCGQDKSLEIQLEESIPTAYVGEVYDFQDCFVQEDGYSYSIDVYSYHGATYTETKLDVDGLTFVPTNTDPISVVLHGNKGNTNLEKTVAVDVKEKGDPIDELLINTGASGYADPGFTKTLNTQVAYKRPGSNNKTSLAVSYSGNQNYYAGGAVFCPNNFRCLDCWKDKDWKNAILRFWVYNDSDYDIEFGLRIKDEFTGSVDLDMTQDGNPSKFAKAHDWTEILFPLRPLGITHTLYQNEEGTRNDSLTIKAKWGGVEYHSDPTELILHPIPMHSYNFYVDEIDIVPASDYPDIPTDLPDTLDRMINGTWCDPNFTREVVFDKDFIHDGESSIKFTLTGKTDYAGTQGMCLNDPRLVPLWEDQTWDNAITNFWVYNPTNYNINIQYLLKDDQRNFVVDWNTEYSKNEVALPGQWTQIFFSMNRVGVNRPLYKDSLNKDEFNIKFLWDGPANTEYTFYVDNVNVQSAYKYPEVDTTRVVPSRLETIEDGWENMARDNGWEKGTISTEMNEVCTSTYPESATSSKIEFLTSDTVNHNANPDYILSPQDQFGEDLPNFVGKTLEFDVKFSVNITNYEIGLKIVEPNWTDKIYLVTPVAGEDGWMHAVIDFSNYPDDDAALSSVIRIGFIFNGVDDTNKSSAYAFLDNIFFDALED